MNAGGFEVSHNQYPEIPQILSPELAYFLGLVITDGHVQHTSFKQKERSTCYIYTSYESEVEIITPLIQEIFNYTPKIYPKKKKGFNKRVNYQISINSKPLACFLNKKFSIPFGAKSHFLKVPSAILNSTKINKASFLRGVIDGDGSIKKNKVLSICSASRIFLRGINKILNSLDIQTKNILISGSIFLIYISNKRDLNRIYFNCYKNQKYCYLRKIISLEKIIFKSGELEQNKVLA
ncbi:hypothetical protein HOF78_03280 [Candidatus Woesearchaeota archaeon]|nr:hypothetical protein [Candidatus Woesearchaeota archaeon]